eukprot:scaffold650924_cov43-Prasinocladus_malaysianus.AAC.1
MYITAHSDPSVLIDGAAVHVSMPRLHPIQDAVLAVNHRLGGPRVRQHREGDLARGHNVRWRLCLLGPGVQQLGRLPLGPIPQQHVCAPCNQSAGHARAHYPQAQKPHLL